MARPRKLKPDERTLGTLQGLAQIHCTQREAAACFNVTLPTFQEFLSRYKIARATWDKGLEEGKTSLRRTQLRLAQSNAGMAIFLGKNLLGQTDQVDHNVSGTVQHQVSVELQQILKVVDGNSRSIPTHTGLEAISGPRVEAGSPLQDRRPNGSNGHIPEE